MSAAEILWYLRSIQLPKERRRSVRASVKHDKRGFVLGYGRGEDPEARAGSVVCLHRGLLE